MRFYLQVFLLSFFTWVQVWGQQIQGYVYDEATKEPLIGVNVFYKEKGIAHGTISDVNGHYELAIPNLKEAILNFSYLGYETVQIPVSLSGNRTRTQDVYLKIQSNVMDEVVVSVGRYEQKLSDVTVSMELLKANEINRQSPKDLTSVLKNLSGVEINDNQPSVRGGTGWTYGVGSRCLVMVDGMSVMTPGTGEINWNMVPMESIEQVEVLKGASSVLYGSSALNGLIHVRTKRPNLEPATSINMMGGLYSKADEGTPMYGSVDLSHTRRIKNLDLTLGGNLLWDDGYRESNYNHRVHLGAGLTFHDPNIEGLSYGANINYLYNDYAAFFMWRSPEEYYKQSPLANMGRREHDFYIDPFLTFTNTEKGTTHRLRGRFFRRQNSIINHASDKTLTGILSNMGFQQSSIPELTNLVQNWQTQLLPRFLPYAPQLLNGQVSGLMNELGGLINQYFPNAQYADAMDLMSWIMKHEMPTNGTMEDWMNYANQTTPATDPGDPDQTYCYNLDYQYSKKFDHSQFTVGGMFEHLYAKSQITGTHKSDNVAIFMQYDHKFFDRLNVSAGMRWEYYRVDDFYREAETNIFGAKVPVKPVFRGGLNYELAEASFLRFSIGQGYRYPSVTEKFILKDIGGVGAYPNPELKAETGYNVELGLKQGYKLGNLAGFIDLAGFYSRYKNMIEFRMGTFNNTTLEYIDSTAKLIDAIMSKSGVGFGAQFTNVSRAEIYGIDLSTTGSYAFTPKSRLNYSLGYVYTNPIDMDNDARRLEEEANTDLMAMRNKSNDSKYLKYRQKHTVKAVLDWEWNRFSVGTNMAWRSKTLATDYFWVDEREKSDQELMDYLRLMLYGDLHNYWIENNNGYFTMDLRAGMNITPNIGVQALINNVLDTRYCGRPMDVAAPRTFVVKLNMKF